MEMTKEVLELASKAKAATFIRSISYSKPVPDQGMLGKLKKIVDHEMNILTRYPLEILWQIVDM